MTGRSHEIADGEETWTRAPSGADRRRRRIGCAIAAPSRPKPLTPEALAAVATALERERQSHEFHAAVLARFPGAMPFRLTVEAEARHAAALEALLRRRGLAVPEAPSTGGATIDHTVPATLGAACLEAVTAKEDRIRIFERVLLPLVAGYPDVERVFARIVEAARERHLPALRHWAGDHHRDGEGGERI